MLMCYNTEEFLISNLTARKKAPFALEINIIHVVFFQKSSKYSILTAICIKINDHLIIIE